MSLNLSHPEHFTLINSSINVTVDTLIYEHVMKMGGYEAHIYTNSIDNSTLILDILSSKLHIKVGWITITTILTSDEFQSLKLYLDNKVFINIKN